MNYQWQSEIFTILDRNHVSMYDLLVFTLRTRLLPVHSSHRELLQHRTGDVLDLWSEQFPSDTRTWALQVARETYRSEIITLIHPHTGFHFRAYGHALNSLRISRWWIWEKKSKRPLHVSGNYLVSCWMPI
jgi:hypothetical protein